MHYSWAAVVATARLIKCMQVVSEPDSGGIVSCRGFGEIGDDYDRPLRGFLSGQVAVGVSVPAAGGAGLDKWTAGGVDAASGGHG